MTGEPPLHDHAYEAACQREREDISLLKSALCNMVCDEMAGDENNLQLLCEQLVEENGKIIQGIIAAERKRHEELNIDIETGD